MPKKQTTTKSRSTPGKDLTRDITKFVTIIDELKDLHLRKSRDYGTKGDTYYNFRSATECGVPSWVGVLIRMGDKMQRLRKFAKHGHLENEGVLDSLNDLAVYSIIARVLLEQEIMNELALDRERRAADLARPKRHKRRP